VFLAVGIHSTHTRYAMRLAQRDTEPSQPYVVPPSQQFDGNDGSWSTFLVSVGTPGQDFRVLPSTKGGVTYLIAPEACLKGIDPEACPQSRGAEVFNSVQNIGFQTNASSTWSVIGQYDVDLEDALNYTSAGLFGVDTVRLGRSSVSTSLFLDRQIVAGIVSPDYYMGVLPLGITQSSFSSLGNAVEPLLYQLRNTSKIPSLSYAYTAGAPYRLKSVFGSLILGGYDSTRFEANTSHLSFTFSNDPSKLLTVGVGSIIATNTLHGTFSLTSSAHFSVIDSTVSHLWLPTDICSEFETAFGLTYDPVTDLYLVNSTIHQQLVSNNPTITLKLVNSLAGSSENYTNIQLPYAAFDLQVSSPYYSTPTRYFPIRRAANSTQYVLGRTLLQEAYLIVDYERANFTLAQAAWPDPLPASNIVTIPSRASTSSLSTSSSKNLSTGTIVGIAIGAASLILLILLVLLFLLRRRRRRPIPSSNPTAIPKQCELTSPVASSSTEIFTSPIPRKVSGPQELSGTPLIELALPDSTHTPPQPPAYPHTEPTYAQASALDREHDRDLDSHGHFQDRKTLISVNDNNPAELHAESRTPMTPRWQELTFPLPMIGPSPSSSSSSSSSSPPSWPRAPYAVRHRDGEEHSIRSSHISNNGSGDPSGTSHGPGSASASLLDTDRQAKHEREPVDRGVGAP